MIRVYLQSSFVLFMYFLFLVLLDTSQSEDIGIYWGQEKDEGSLAETCATGKYSYVNIAFLYTFDNGQTPEINLQGYCDNSPNGCTSISSDIRDCQKQGIKVMLSVFGGGVLTSNDSKQISDYLRNNFLGGYSSSRPLGDVILDGIDFLTDNDWDDVARYLKSSSKQNIYLGATSVCSLQNVNVLSILKSGLFDYLRLLFVGDPCQYKEGNIDNLISSWNQWKTIKVGKIFLGLTASPNASLPDSGYSPAHLLNSQILPIIRTSPKYGGVMLWSRFYDKQSNYSDSITSPLCRQQIPPQCRISDPNFVQDVGYMSMASFTVNVSEAISRHCCEMICWNNCSCQAYAPTNYATNTGCQIWSKESIFHKSSESSVLPIYVARGKSCLILFVFRKFCFVNMVCSMHKTFFLFFLHVCVW